MAKVTSPLFGFDASGQLGSALVYSTWKGINYVRKYAIPSNPNTSAQQVIRGYFKTAVDAWHAENGTVKTAWTNYAKNHSMAESGFNLYVGKYVKFLIDSSGTPPTVTNTPPNMT